MNQFCEHWDRRLGKRYRGVMALTSHGTTWAPWLLVIVAKAKVYLFHCTDQGRRNLAEYLQDLQRARLLPTKVLIEYFSTGENHGKHS